MPLIQNEFSPRPPGWLFNGHLETIVPSLTRRMELEAYFRERIGLPDGDFLDLDWIKKGNDRLLILTHGLEGNAERPYIKGMAFAFLQEGFDILAWNCRSCSGEMNKSLRMYFHGDTEDIQTVVEHACKTGYYRELILVGFSMGGSILMNYLGRKGRSVPEVIRGGIAFSTPCDLAASAATLNRRENRLYRRRFLKALRPKMERKAALFPGVINLSNWEKVRNWQDFDDYFSAPINGFPDSAALYRAGSAIRGMEGIRVPVLLANAANDPILTPSCSPRTICRDHPSVFLQLTERGGHVAFPHKHHNRSWAEERAIGFYREVIRES